MSADGTIAGRLETVRADLAEAARAAGRDPAGVRLVAVSKKVPAEAVLEAAAAGQRDFGENYVQEAFAKMDAVAAADPRLAGDLRWHMIGRLQSNKAARAGERFDLLHGIDSLSAVRAAARAGSEARPVRLLVQIRLGGGEGRGGVAPGAAEDFVGEAGEIAGVELAGLMAVADPEREPGPQFAALRELCARLRALGLPRAPMTEISAGMSSDYVEAVREGATIVRIGTAIFGPRRAQES